MELNEYINIVLRRVEELEPDNAIKIIGYLLLQDNAQQKIIEYAFGPDEQIQSLIDEAKFWIISMQSYSYMPFSSPSSFRVPTPHWDPHIALVKQSAMQGLNFSPQHNNLIGKYYRNQAKFLSMEEQFDLLNSSSNYLYREAAQCGGFDSRTSGISPSIPEIPAKACHHFYKGYCKHGTNCRYFHGQSIPGSFSQVFSPSTNELVNGGDVFPIESLEKLEMEITELLKGRRGVPVSIAALPMIYFEVYGRTLQDEGYLAESQQHEEAGYNLIKLLARLKNSIRIIDRPYGQPLVVLTEDAPRYMDYMKERSDPCLTVPSSQQIYLTFPAEGTFTNEDVSNYFKQYGPVHNVRIPCQEKRMFGFVSFLYPQSVKAILADDHPHYICGTRVLVKPYKEKSRIIDRKYVDNVELPLYYPSQYLDMDPQFNAMPRLCNGCKLLRKQLLEERKQTLELERRLSVLKLTPKALRTNPYSYKMEEFKLPEDYFSYSPAVNNDSTSDDRVKHTSDNSSDQDSSQIELPDSPFAFPPGGSSIFDNHIEEKGG